MTDWDRSIFDGDLEALLDVHPPVPISRIYALRDLALAHTEVSIVLEYTKTNHSFALLLALELYYTTYSTLH